MNKTLSTNNWLDSFLEVVAFLGFLFTIFCTLLPYDALAEDRLLLLYSGNVKGEIAGCG
jgi:hypothetical protein